jgi:hypothetical protein
MSFQSTVGVEFGQSLGMTSLTNRAQGAQVTTRVQLGDFGSNRAIVTLRNDDGALTPGAGGTYSSVDWYSQALQLIGNTGTYDFKVFYGIITSFSLQDDGVNSTVVLEADDFFTTGGREVSSVVWGPPYGKTNVADFIEDLYNGVTISGFPRNTVISGVNMPRLGSASSNVVVTDNGVGVGSFLAEDPLEFDSPVRDIVRSNLMPSAPSVAWPTKYEFFVSPTRTEYQASSCTTYPVRDNSDPYKVDYTFAEDATSGELPFANLIRGFNTDTLLNNAQIAAATPIGVTASYTNTDSADKYGTHTIQLTSIIPPSNPTTRMPVLAQRWANTFSVSQFTVQQFTITESMVRATVGTSATSEEKWAQLLDIETGPVQVGTIEFTPAGGSTAVTETFVTMSRTIQITPADIRLTVECLPIDQTGAFVLDSSTLGVLDQNRLG